MGIYQYLIYIISQAKVNKMDNTQIFSSRSSSYENARPGYPKGLIDYLYTEQHFSEAKAIADIGSGTGKFARQLLERGSRVFCVEPNPEMRHIAEEKLGNCPGFISVDGTASHTGIAETVDAITAAQAFHWFDAEAFHKECLRILRPGGKIFLIWNLRVPDSDITNACREVFRRFCPRFVDFNTGMKEDDPKIYDFFDRNCEKVIFDNPLWFDEALFVERYLSSSYSLREGEEGYDASIQAVRDIFTHFSSDGLVQLPNRAICYGGSI